MKKIIFIVGPALGHIGRSLVIAKALSLTSICEISFICIDVGKSQPLTPDMFICHKLKAQPANNLQFADDLEALLKQLSPDLICLDMTPIPWLLYVRFPRVRMVYISNFFLTRIGSYETFQEQVFAASKAKINEARVSRGLDPIQHIKNLYEREAVLLCDPSVLVKPRIALPANYHVVGPCTWEPEIDLPVEIERREDLMFVSFGSTGNKQLPRQEAEKIALAIGVETIVWLGVNKIQKAEKTGSVEHLVYPKLPASKVISRARLVITHGGAGSTYQALGNGSPLGVWPSFQNQYILGLIVKESGCGVLVEDILNQSVDIGGSLNSMRSRAKEMAQSLLNVNGPMNAAQTIQQMLS